MDIADGVKPPDLSHEKCRLLFEKMLNGFAYHRAVYDGDGRICDYVFLEANPAFEKITGLKAENVIGKTIRELIPDIDGSWIERYARVAETGEPGFFENYVPQLDRYYRVIAYCPEKGHFAVMFEDVTDNKKMLLKLRDMNERLVEKSKEMEQMLNVASHDLRSPLVNIQGFGRELEKSFRALSAILAGNGVDDETRKKASRLVEDEMPKSVDYIRKSAAKMDSLINSILKLSRIGRAALKFETADMDKIVSEVTRTFEYKIREMGIVVEKNNTPPCYCDAQQIMMAFTNLIDNAIKYRSAQRPLKIKISGYIKDGTAFYIVEDNGTGIDEKYREKIFEIFQRLNPGDSAGEGMGLAIVRKIVSQNNGKVWFEPNPSGGSRFIVSLPATPAS